MEAAFWRLQRQFPPTMWSTLFHAWCVPSLLRVERQKDEGSLQPLLFFGYALRPAKEEPLVQPRKGIEGIEGDWTGNKKKKWRVLKLLNESRCFKGWFLWFFVNFKNIFFKRKKKELNFNLRSFESICDLISFWIDRSLSFCQMFISILGYDIYLFYVQ